MPIRVRTKETTMTIKTYRDLEVWNKAMDLVEQVYRLTSSFPTDERFGLSSQIRRAAVSVPANIAEGHGRLHRKEYVHHLSVARGSLMEVETHLTIAARLQLISREEAVPLWNLAQQVGKLLNGLVAALREKGKPPTPGPRSPAP